MAKKFFLSMWRWHFYAGLFVVPFLFVLATTGMLMLISEPLREWQHADLYQVTEQAQTVSLDAQKQAVESELDGTVSLFIPARSAGQSNQFKLITPQGSTLRVFVNPYSGQVLGSLPDDSGLYSWANDVHGQLMLGDTGDMLVELAASLAVLLVFSGLYLWWPRQGRTLRQSLSVRGKPNKRPFWRDLHANVGLYLSAFLLFFLFSGLSWTNIWGGQFVQAWNTFPASKWSAPLSDKTHADLNHGDHKEVPWNLEQTPLPESTAEVDHSNHGSHAHGAASTTNRVPGRISLDRVAALADQLGMDAYQLNLPTDDQGVYTLSADTMSGDITDPRNDRTLHIDQYSGEVLAEVGFADYSLGAKAMAAGIAWHQGDVGGWNFAFNLLFCWSVMLLCCAAVVAWWKRRPSGSARLEAPPQPDLPIWKSAAVLLLLMSLFFPVAAAALLIFLVADRWLLPRVGSLRAWYQ
ncbi:PepSY domain-containing protein [Saccharospirillum sp. HFRX-1]|uniref:PepSY-associated TM helix domain-containing protein n=1 Tax=unclassified Saccharospirillum TaxID=2633430 RepID=UPI0037131C5F